ncbi:recombinase RecT [Thioclava dalianensis]|nr:recombinase RecT [Thioclava dalianensis]
MNLTKTPLRQVSNVQGLLKNEGARDQLAAVAAKHLTPERMMRVVANAIRTTPKLQQCEPISFLGAMMQCASLGLEPNTILGHAYLVPFDNKRKNITEVQVIVGYKGLIDLARRSGHITSISANIHYSDDKLWLYEEGTDAKLRHQPGPQQGEKLDAYAIAQFKDGGHAYVVLPWAHIMKIRDGSQGYQSAVRYGKEKTHPWVAYEDEMAKKTAIRALSKYLPLSVEFRDAVEIDENRADYAAFAMDPTDGVTINMDGEIEDESDEPEKEEQRSAEKTKAEPKMRDVTPEQDAAPKDEQKEERKPAAKKQESAPEADQDPEPEHDDGGLKHSKRGKEEPEKDLSWALQLRNKIGGDLLDGDVDTVLKQHEEGIKRAEVEAPEIHASIMEEVQFYRDQGA